MPAVPGVWPLNNISTQDNYVTALTAVFPIGRRAFSLQVYTAAVYYKVIAFRPPAFYYVVEPEHFVAPVLANFTDPIKEGLQPGEIFGGILLRSAIAGSPAKVTVI